MLGTVYDGLRGGVVRTLAFQMPSYVPADPAAQNAVLDVALDEMAGKLKAVTALSGLIFAVSSPYLDGPAR
jgi:hypothetical protein